MGFNIALQNSAIGRGANDGKFAVEICDLQFRCSVVAGGLCILFDLQRNQRVIVQLAEPLQIHCRFFIVGSGTLLLCIYLFEIQSCQDLAGLDGIALFRTDYPDQATRFK